MSKADEAIKKYNEGLAKNFLIAYLAHFHDVTFQTAQKYVKDENQIGEFWCQLAEVVTEAMNKKIDDQYKHLLKGEKVIELDQVD